MAALGSVASASQRGLIVEGLRSLTAEMAASLTASGRARSSAIAVSLSSTARSRRPFRNARVRATAPVATSASASSVASRARVQRSSVAPGLRAPAGRDTGRGAALRPADDGNQAVHGARSNHGEPGDRRLAGHGALGAQIGGERLNRGGGRLPDGHRLIKTQTAGLCSCTSRPLIRAGWNVRLLHAHGERGPAVQPARLLARVVVLRRSPRRSSAFGAVRPERRAR